MSARRGSAAWFAPLLRDRLARAGLAIILGFAILAVVAPVVAPHDPVVVNAVRRLEGPSFAHPLGTDALGRDLLSRLLHGARWSLGGVALATALITTVGVTIGMVAGYVGGIVDEILMRTVDVVLAFPGLVLALAVAGILGSGIASVTVALVSVWWASHARLVRGLVLTLRAGPVVEAARALGAREGRILARHVLPDVLPAAVVLATLEMGELVLVIAGLGFLGLGAQPPVAEWGAMVSEGRRHLLDAPQLTIYPGLAISLAVLGFNLLGEGVRDVLDPHTVHTRVT
ncbi:MAG: ABC transporter permease subunit [Gemmatimonadaceae bacterium]